MPSDSPVNKNCVSLRSLLTGPAFKDILVWNECCIFEEMPWQMLSKGQVIMEKKDTNNRLLICFLLLGKGLPSSTSQSTRKPPLSPDVTPPPYKQSCCSQEEENLCLARQVGRVKARQTRSPFVFVLTMSPRTPGGPGAPNSP